MSTLATALDPDITEEDAHDAWIRTELTRRLHSVQGTTPHEEVMAEMDALIARIAAEQQA